MIERFIEWYCKVIVMIGVAAMLVLPIGREKLGPTAIGTVIGCLLGWLLTRGR